MTGGELATGSPYMSTSSLGTLLYDLRQVFELSWNWSLQQQADMLCTLEIICRYWFGVFLAKRLSFCALVVGKNMINKRFHGGKPFAVVLVKSPFQ